MVSAAQELAACVFATSILEGSIVWLSPKQLRSPSPAPFAFAHGSLALWFRRCRLGQLNGFETIGSGSLGRLLRSVLLNDQHLYMTEKRKNLSIYARLFGASKQSLLFFTHVL